MNDRDSFLNLLDDSTLIPSTEWAERMRIKYPYFVIPTLLLMERNGNALNSKERETLISYLAINTPDRSALAKAINEDATRFNSFYPTINKLATTDTTSTIDVFLNKFGNSSDKESQAIENIIFNPTPEYGLSLIEEEKGNPTPQPKDEQDLLIDSFIAKREKEEHTNEDAVIAAVAQKPDITEITTPPPIPEFDEEQSTEDSESLSESLAKVYIKQKKYAKAYDILISVSRKDTSHSPYIEDQLRFLLKIMKATGISPSR